MSTTFPLFNRRDKSRLNAVYRIKESEPDDDGVPFDTLGDGGPTALTQSALATGIQRAVFNMAGETNFACPAQWLAETFSQGSRQTWRYQYSTTPSYHGSDWTAYFVNNVTMVPDAGFRSGFQKT